MTIEISKLAILKLLELGIAATCLGFHYRSQTFNFDCDTVSVTAFGGFVIVAAGSLIGYLMESPINRKIDTFFCLLGCALFSTAGALNIIFFDRYTRSDWKHYGLAKGILSIVGSALHLLDCVLSWRENKI